MMESDIINAVATAVIAFVSVIGVWSTVIYYLTNIQRMTLSILLLISFIYITSVVLCVRYIRTKIPS